MIIIQTLTRGIKRIKNWPMWLAEYFKLLPKKDFIYYHFRDGSSMKARPYTADRGIVQEVLLHDCYDYVSDGEETVIDIGAQAGYFSSYALMKGAKKVIAFEPVDENFTLAEANMKNATESSMFMDQDYYLYNTAVVGSDIDELKIFMDENSSGGHSAYDETVMGDNYITAPTDNINEVIDRLVHVDLLKCDCEGGEYDIFFNMSPKNLRKIDRLIIEAHPLGDGKMPIDLINFFTDNKFDVDTRSEDVNELCVLRVMR